MGNVHHVHWRREVLALIRAKPVIVGNLVSVGARNRFVTLSALSIAHCPQDDHRDVAVPFRLGALIRSLTSGFVDLGGNHLAVVDLDLEMITLTYVFRQLLTRYADQLNRLMQRLS